MIFFRLQAHFAWSHRNSEQITFFFLLFLQSFKMIFFQKINCPISMRFSPTEILNNSLVENAKKQETKIFDFRLTLLDRITFNHSTYDIIELISKLPTSDLFALIIPHIYFFNECKNNSVFDTLWFIVWFMNIHIIIYQNKHTAISWLVIFDFYHKFDSIIGPCNTHNMGQRQFQISPSTLTAWPIHIKSNFDKINTKQIKTRPHNMIQTHTHTLNLHTPIVIYGLQQLFIMENT